MAFTGYFLAKLVCHDYRVPARAQLRVRPSSVGAFLYWTFVHDPRVAASNTRLARLRLGWDNPRLIISRGALEDDPMVAPHTNERCYGTSNLGLQYANRETGDDWNAVSTQSWTTGEGIDINAALVAGTVWANLWVPKKQQGLGVVICVLGYT